MIIRNIINEDIDELVRLHKSIFSKNHFSSNFPLNLLKKYFFELFNHYEYKLLAIENGAILGYLIAGIKPEYPINKFIKKNIIRILFVLLYNPKYLIEKIYQVISKIGKTTNITYENSVSVYLIAVKPDTQNKGIGRQLLHFFEDILMQRKIYHYTLSVRIKNSSSIEFYKKNKFTEINRNFLTISFKKSLFENNII